MPVCDNSDLKNEAQAVTRRPIARQSKLDVMVVLKRLYDVGQAVFLNLAFGADVVVER